MAVTHLKLFNHFLSIQFRLMKGLNLFSGDEIKIMADSRAHLYEGALAEGGNNFQNILIYIRYELHLLTLIREKIVEADLLVDGPDKVTDASEKCFREIFPFLIDRYPSELQMWVLYIHFCKQTKDAFTLEGVLEKMVDLHSDKPNIFQLASRCATEDLKSLEKARGYIVRGMKIHDDSKALHREAITLELAVFTTECEKYSESLNAADAEKRADGDNAPGDKDADDDIDANGDKGSENDSIRDKDADVVNDDGDISDTDDDSDSDDDEDLQPPVSIEMIERTYSAALDKIDSCDFFLDLYGALQQVSFMDSFKIRLHNDLLTKFGNEENVWDTLAGIKKEEMDFERNPEFLKIVIAEIIEIYSEAVEKFDTQSMWEMYVTRLFDIDQDTSINVPTYKRNCLVTALRNAHERRKLSERFYLLWSELFTNINDKLHPLRFGVKNLPLSIKLWSNLLTNRFTSGHIDEAKQSFAEAVAIFKRTNPSDALPLWKLMLRSCQILKPKYMKTLFERGILPRSGVAVEMKPAYLEWMIVSYGHIKARSLYDRISVTQPLSLLLHETMIKMENHQAEYNIDFVRSCYNLATQQFGAGDVPIWVKYIEFETTYGMSRTGLLRIKEVALQNLFPSLADEFKAQFEQFLKDCIDPTHERFAMQMLLDPLPPPPLPEADENNASNPPADE